MPAREGDPMSPGHIIPGWDGGSDAPEAATTPPAPEPSHAERARTLVTGGTRGALCTIGLNPAGTPFGSVVTYGLDPAGQPCFFVSTMAEHTRNLLADPRASLLVVEETPAGADPLASGRVTLLGSVAEVTDPAERAASRDGYLRANPAAFYVDYGDFLCMRLGVTDIRYVGGFGRMSWVDAAGYAAAQVDPLVSGAAEIISHMNADHGGALVTLCHRFAGRSDVVSASMTSVDRYGFEVIAKLGEQRQQALRIGFRTQQESPQAVRRELISMLDQARAQIGGGWAG
jgi:putative heme iron utilization protein